MTRSLTPRARALLTQLAEIRPRVLGRVNAADRETAVRLLDELAAMRELASVAALTSYLTAPEPLRSRAFATVCAILERVPAYELLWLDERCRAFAMYGSRYWHWRDMNPRVLEQRDIGVHALGVLSFHPNGWIRQAALARLLHADDPKRLGYVLVRANDWVAPIRDTARRAVTDLVSTLPAEIVADALDALVAAARWRRGGYCAFHDDLLRGLADRGDAISRAWTSRCTRVRRAAFHVCSRDGDGIGMDYISIALCDLDSGIRIAAANAAAQSCDPARRSAYLETMRQDPWPAIRNRALRVIAADDGAERDLRLEPFLFDRSYAIRFVARHRMGRDRTWYAAGYRRHLGDRKRLIASVYGLGETGEACDAKRLSRFLESDSPGLVCAALTALDALDPQQIASRLVDFLAHGQPAISKRARTLMISANDEDQLQQVCRVFDDPGCEPHARVNALRLLARASKWERILHFMRAVNDRDRAVRELAQMWIERWIRGYNRSFIEPSSEQMNRIVAQSETMGDHEICRFLSTLSAFQGR